MVLVGRSELKIEMAQKPLFLGRFLTTTIYTSSSSSSSSK
jgi:hypothetical protein